MKICQRYLLLSLMLSLGFMSSAFAGQTPFSGTVKEITQEAYVPSIDETLPPLVEGKVEVGTVEVSTSLNIRTSPWGDITGSLNSGDKVNIIGQVGDWYKVSVNGKTAYVHSAYVKRQGEGEKPFPKSGWVNSPLGLNIRRVPHGDKIGVLKDQHEVEILGVSGNYYKIKYGDNNEAFVCKHYIDTDQPSAPKEETQKESFTGYVTASSGLNVRKAPWGAIDTAITKGTSVKVVGKINDWYEISFNGKTRYVHSNYISKNKVSSAPVVASNTTTSSQPSGPLQQRIANSARQLVGSTKFRTADVGYGNLACAKVVTTALKNAGALEKVHLNCRSTVQDLKQHGWKEVEVPPFCEGDVITWKTYDYTGDGIKDPDTHIGIICKEGNKFMAMNNSSRLRTPRMLEPFAIKPVTRVLRKV